MRNQRQRGVALSMPQNLFAASTGYLVPSAAPVRRRRARVNHARTPIEAWGVGRPGEMKRNRDVFFSGILFESRWAEDMPPGGGCCFEVYDVPGGFWRPGVRLCLYWDGGLLMVERTGKSRVFAPDIVRYRVRRAWAAGFPVSHTRQRQTGSSASHPDPKRLAPARCKMASKVQLHPESVHPTQELDGDRKSNVPSAVPLAESSNLVSTCPPRSLYPPCLRLAIRGLAPGGIQLRACRSCLLRGTAQLPRSVAASCCRTSDRGSSATSWYVLSRGGGLVGREMSRMQGEPKSGGYAARVLEGAGFSRRWLERRSTVQSDSAMPGFHLVDSSRSRVGNL